MPKDDIQRALKNALDKLARGQKADGQPLRFATAASEAHIFSRDYVNRNERDEARSLQSFRYRRFKG